MLADKKTPSPNTQAIPAAQWMKDIAPISVWVIGWMDQIRLGPKGMSMCPRSCLLEYVWLGTGRAPAIGKQVSIRAQLRLADPQAPWQSNKLYNNTYNQDEVEKAYAYNLTS